MSKKIVILGAGESGVGAAILAKKNNFDIFVSDTGTIKDKYRKELEERNIAFEENKHTEKIILSADEIIKSPGIPDTIDIIKKAKQKNIPIISEIEFAYRYTKAKLVCVTGSNGKTTTTLLTYEIFKNAGLNVGLAGNIGNSFARQVAEKDYDYYVLEISSFQLDNTYKFKADTSVLLNITPDHLDRYDYNFDNYIKSKMRIAQNQKEKDYFIYNIDDENILKYVDEVKAKKLPMSIKVELDEGAYLDAQMIKIKAKQQFLEMLAGELSLKGKHNIYNSMAAAIAAQVNDIKNPVIRNTLMTFKNIEHRLEEVAIVRGVKFINDSKATNVNAVWYALEAIDKNIILILGGLDKGNDYSEILKLVREKVKYIVALGKDNSKIIKYFSPFVEVINTNSMQEAVKQSYIKAEEGDTVLLSPACASFDLFKSYEDRGQQFKHYVLNL